MMAWHVDPDRIFSSAPPSLEVMSMPTITVELSRAQLNELEAYAQRHQLTVAEVICRAVDRFLALACIEPDDVSLVDRETNVSFKNDLLDHGV
jgi:hypothetical protein